MKKTILFLLCISMIFSLPSCTFPYFNQAMSSLTSTPTTQATKEPTLLDEYRSGTVDPKSRPYGDILYQLDFLGKKTHGPYMLDSWNEENIFWNGVYGFFVEPYIDERLSFLVYFCENDTNDGSTNEPKFYIPLNTHSEEITFIDSMPSTLVHTPRTEKPYSFYQLSKNVYYEYTNDCIYDKDIKDLTSITFISPNHLYTVRVICYYDSPIDVGRPNGFEWLTLHSYSDYSDHIIARMLNPETALEATNEFWEIVFPDSAKSPAK